ncbi:MAG: hypothetical protein HYY06_33150 [Deltaproteobacteria bacterium]|nr:hypothetical protein [Deltaproteobacteria bacterium]
MKRFSLWLLVGALGCSDGDIGVTGPGGGGGGGDGRDDVTGGCTDADEDGFGVGCEQGVDCNDADPNLNADCDFRAFGDPWSPEQADGLVIDENGALTLGEDELADDNVWTANAEEGTVSKLDARTGRELARYPSAIAGGNDARPWNEPCNYGSAGNCPSRTSIDFRRDCFVANRAFGNQGTLTKIANRIEDCVDRNGNGVIDTSRDANDSGTVEPGEIVGDDECVLYTVNVGGLNGMPRALAVAPDTRFVSAGGNAWVGTNGERRGYEVNGNDGAILRTVELPINPYGALAGKLLGLVWFTNVGVQAAPNNPPAIVAVEFANGTVHPRQEVQSTVGCTGTYGITIDGQGRVWTGGYPCEAIFRYEGTADAGSWLSVDLGGQGRTRGLVASDDDRIWVAHSHLADGGTVGNLTSVDAETGAVLERHTLPTGKQAIGVDLDRQGNIWTIARETSSAAKLDPSTGVFQEFPVGNGPYTYSDFTGHSLRLQFPQGVYTDVAEACGAAGAMWKTAHWEGDVPEGAVVELRARTATTREGLADAEWYGPWTESPVDLESPPGPLPEGSFLEFELTLRSLDNATTPHLTGFVVTYACALQ